MDRHDSNLSIWSLPHWGFHGQMQMPVYALTTQFILIKVIKIINQGGNNRDGQC
ncbi:hypothetical protein CRENPOLYSF1_170069 [Crenothrix polyspora]|uniref:Uncharacterized protein n=1 Tax=Crenothrix polyspora TaxID=360316 RepID=A0A1R4H4C3_9GAMM|nr:hypothetical protein CRENPOLYSF1_170069 [Crenothrix polyspora]